MNKTDVIHFFNQKASSWDETTIRREDSIKVILEKGGIEKGKAVLDVACGTGVLFPDYLKLNVKSVLGVDISPKMVEYANNNFNDERIKVICDDAETMKSESKFDCIMIHNAFPHFENPVKLIENLSSLLDTDGRLTIAHSMSKKEIDECHSGGAKSVSVALMEADDLKELMGKFLEVDTVISDDKKYIVSGKRK